MNATKDYLGFENARNKRNADLYTRIMKAAVADGRNVAVLIGHHLTFEIDGDLGSENEIPSADCLIFDHDIMGKVFGERAIPIMRALAEVPCEQRDPLLASFMDTRHVNKPATIET